MTLDDLQLQVRSFVEFLRFERLQQLNNGLDLHSFSRCCPTNVRNHA